jgi:hypothetical protein
MPTSSSRTTTARSKASRKVEANAYATMKPLTFLDVRPSKSIKDALSADLKKLLDLPARLGSAATRQHDGRLTKVVLVTVHDLAGQSRPGVPVHLLDDAGSVVDRAFTSRTGLVVLTFPSSGHAHDHDHDHDDAEAEAPAAVSGLVRILDGTEQGIVEPVTVPAQSQFTDVVLALPALPAVPEVEGLWPPAGSGGSPLSELPPDFSPELCEAIAAKAGDEGDSLLGQLGKGDDFRTRRTPLVKRMTVVRNGEQTITPNSTEPRRYLVRLRQSWVFLGYTLGELTEVDALDPGQVLDETVGTLERTVDQVSQAVDRARQLASSSLFDSLSQTNRIDSLVRVATTSEAHAAAGGFAIGVPGLFGIGGGGAVAGLSATATTSTRVDTSLQVNHALSTSQSVVNEAVHNAMSSVHSLARTVTSKIGQTSPLLSRVTNLLRWRVYENYAVCTHVEDVLELVSVKVLDIPEASRSVDGVVETALFTAEEVVEYRRFFEPALLDSRYRAAYPGLVQAVREKAGGGRPISHVTVDAAYSASLATGQLTVEVNGASSRVSLPPGGTRARVVVRFSRPVPAAVLTSMQLRLTATPAFPATLWGFTLPASGMTVDVTSVQLWAGSEPGTPATYAQGLGSALHAEAGGSAVADLTFTVPPPVDDTRNDPLFVHVNQNPSYYIGVLAQAALLNPSLREDSHKLQAIPADVWRLPIVGFEGSRIVVAKDADPASEDVLRLLGDKGAATLVQLAAPGAYSEALQGLLSLADAEGLVHPKLLPVPAPAVPPLAVVDLTGQQLIPAPATTSPVVPSPTPTPSPGPVPVPPL